ncbi:hypothetical protein Zm00014a_001033 [Zea mays]|nr:hypothetical protein Zm00014a_001033 [Zea mays]
MPVTND